MLLGVYNKWHDECPWQLPLPFSQLKAKWAEVSSQPVTYNMSRAASCIRWHHSASSGFFWRMRGQHPLWLGCSLACVAKLLLPLAHLALPFSASSLKQIRCWARNSSLDTFFFFWQSLKVFPLLLCKFWDADTLKWYGDSIFQVNWWSFLWVLPIPSWNAQLPYQLYKLFVLTFKELQFLCHLPFQQRIHSFSVFIFLYFLWLDPYWETTLLVHYPLFSQAPKCPGTQKRICLGLKFWQSWPLWGKHPVNGYGMPSWPPFWKKSGI